MRMYEYISKRKIQKADAQSKIEDEETGTDETVGLTGSDEIRHMKNVIHDEEVNSDSHQRWGKHRKI